MPSCALRRLRVSMGYGMSLSGLRMLVCLRMQMSTKEKEAELRAMQEKYGVDGASLPHRFHRNTYPLCMASSTVCCEPTRESCHPTGI